MTIGTLHATYVWDGEILFYYGIMLLVLFPFLHRKPKTLLIWAGALFLLFTAASYGDTPEQFKTPEMLEFVQETDELYAKGSYSAGFPIFHTANVFGGYGSGKVTMVR
ncbi:MAG: hypothetical protein ACI4XL_04715 [Bacillus sp. (in: firmicutes)]